MSNDENQPKGPLEDMLRRWGAHEAARNTAIGPAPVPHRGVLRSLWRWAPLAAAVLLAAGAWALWSATGPGHKAEGQEAQQLRTQRDKWEKEYRDSWALWQRTQAQLQKESERAALSERRLRDLQAKVAAQPPPDVQKEIADLNVEVARLNRTIRQQDQAAKQQAELIEKMKIDLAEATKTSETPTSQGAQDLASMQRDRDTAQKQAELLQTRLKAAGEEMVRWQRADDLARQLQKTEDELASAKAKQMQNFTEMQAAYLSVAAPSEEGLRARQTASKRSHMVQRTMALRRESRDQALTQLLDRLEVVLTRLDMLQTYDSYAAGGFAKLLDNGGVVRKIDELLASDMIWTKARTYLMEAKLILAGAEHVG